MALEIRKTLVAVEEIWHEGGPRLVTPLRVVTGAAVVRNPFAGRYVEDLLPFMNELKALGRDLAQRMLDALGVEPKRIEAYGKGAIVGVAGELEHGALWHEPGGYGMRAVLGGTKAIVPASKRLGELGTKLIVPLGHVNAAYVRSHFLNAEIGFHDAPKPDEIVYGLAMSTGGRVHARAGGLTVAEISVGDGQR